MHNTKNNNNPSINQWQTETNMGCQKMETWGAGKGSGWTPGSNPMTPHLLRLPGVMLEEEFDLPAPWIHSIHIWLQCDLMLVLVAIFKCSIADLCFRTTGGGREREREREGHWGWDSY